MLTNDTTIRTPGQYRYEPQVIMCCGKCKGRRGKLIRRASVPDEILYVAVNDPF